MTDLTAGKNTLGVLLGKRGAKIEYALLLVGAYVAPAVLVFADEASALVLLPLLTLPMALSLCRTIFREEGEVLNSALAGTARLTLLFCLLFSAGLILS